MSLLRRIAFAALVAAAVAAGLGGCASLEQKTEHAIGWVRGALQTNVDASLERTARATVAALNDMKFMEVASKSDVLTAVLTAKTAKGEKVTVELTSISEVKTVVDIRVGVISDQAAAMKVLERIRKHL